MKCNCTSLLILFFLFFILQGCEKKEEGDGIKPVIVVQGYNPMYWALELPYVDSGAYAYDISSSGDTVDLTGSIVVDDGVDVAVVGEYRVTYNVKDGSGLAADEQVRIVKVVMGK